MAEQGRLDYHPAANLLPKMTEEELDGLAKDIAAHGQRVPIIVHKGLILDGRHRYEACAIAGVEPKFVEWDGKGGSPTIFVVSLNAHRRHMTPSQKAMLAVEVLALLEGEARDRKAAAGVRAAAQTNAKLGRGDACGHDFPQASPAGDAEPAEPHRSRDDAVQAVGGGVSGRYVQEAKSLKEEHPDLAGEVLAGTKTLPEAKREVKQKAIRAKAEAAKESTPTIPRVYTSMQELTWAVSGGDEQPFACIYADPPWPYENQGTRGATDNEYVTMSMEDIYALPVVDIAAKDSLLFLWATSTLLPDAFECMKRWGFAYKSHLVWDKSPRFGLGNYFRICTEFLLVGIRGKPVWLRKDVPSIYRGEAAEHSKKPDAIRDLVESCALGPHVELFARVAAPRWASMGNEVVAALGKQEAKR